MLRPVAKIIAVCSALLIAASPALAASPAETARAEFVNPNAGSGRGIYAGTKAPGSVTVAIETMAVMNTLRLTYADEMSIARHCFDTLVKRDANNAVIPGAAESWEQSEDGMKWTFRLRPAKWVDSAGNAVADVKASDFVYAWSKLLDPATASEYWHFASIFKNAAAYYEHKSGKEGAAEVKLSDVGFRAVDDRTLEIELETYVPYVLQSLATETLSPVCEEFCTKIGPENYGLGADKMAYNGPFRMTKWVEETSVTLAKNDLWHDAANVELKELIFAKYTDANTRINAFEGGEVDLINLTGEQAAMIEKDGYKVSTFIGGFSYILRANCLPEAPTEKDPNAKLSPLRSVSLRRAISAAIDRGQMVASIFKGENEPSKAFTLAISGISKPMFSDAVVEANGGKPLYAPGPQIETAKAHLKLAMEELGVSDPKDIKIGLVISETTENLLFAQALQEQLRRVLGITLDIELMTGKESRARRNAKNYDLFYGAWGPDYNDPMTDLDLWATDGSSGHTGYSNPEYDALIEAARSERDLAKREQLFVKAEMILARDVPIIPIFWRHENYAMSEKIASGAVRLVFHDNDLIYVKLSK